MIFFDFDGTLLESNGAWADIDRTFLGRHAMWITAPTTPFPTPPTTPG